MVPDLVFTSVLKRAIRTQWLMLDELDLLWLPVERNWRLNERHYGALQGLNKAQTVERHGEAQVQDLATQLRHTAAAARVRTTSATRASIRRYRRRRARRPARHRVAQGHAGARTALLATDASRRNSKRGPAGAGGRAWQQPAGAGEDARWPVRAGDRRAQYSDRRAAAVRVRRCAAAAPQPLSGRSGSDPGRRRGGQAADAKSNLP